MAKHSFADSGGDLRKYFAAIPNIVFTLGLNPYELALYAHFKQAAGDDGGVCWKSRATISRESGMSAGMVTKARLALEKPRAELSNRPLITVTEEPSKTGGHPTCAVTITDIWPINMAKFSTSPHDVATSLHDGEVLATSPRDQQRHHATLATSPHSLKEKPMKKNQEEVVRQRGTRLPDDFAVTSEMRTWAAQNTPHVSLSVAFDEFVDYWRGVPGTRGRKLDWPATFRNRLRDLEGRASRNGNGHQTITTASERRVDQLKSNVEFLRSGGRIANR